ncbi:MAG: LD-carboxypeptidase, partial [Chitinophagaceae bacterium]
MKRKDFLSSFGVAALAAGSISSTIAAAEKKIITPPYLNAGDTIGITSPAGYIKTEEIQSAINKIKEWGYNVKIGDTIGKRAFTFGGTDEERKNDFQQMMDDDAVKAILCARGGYGFVRLVDQLNFKKFKKQPKWIIGFSDITVLHSHLNSCIGVASIHSKMCNSFPDDWGKAELVQIETIESIRKAISGARMIYT